MSETLILALGWIAFGAGFFIITAGTLVIVAKIQNKWLAEDNIRQYEIYQESLKRTYLRAQELSERAKASVEAKTTE